VVLRRYHDNVADAEDNAPEGDAQSPTNDIGDKAGNKSSDQGTD